LRRLADVVVNAATKGLDHFHDARSSERYDRQDARLPQGLVPDWYPPVLDPEKAAAESRIREADKDATFGLTSAVSPRRKSA